MGSLFENKRRITNWLILLACSITLIYIGLRAYFIGPYQDEISSYFWYAQKGSVNPYYAHLDANNHVVNSFFAHISYLFFGTKLFFYRLPNVLSFIMFSYYLFKITTLLKSQLLRLGLVLTFVSSIFYISFFSIARGYGISYAFLIASIYYLLANNKEFKLKYLVLGLIFLSFSLWANLSVLISALAIFGVYAYQILKFKQVSLKTILSVFVFVIPAYFAIDFALVLKNNGSLYLGIEGDFFYDGVVPLFLNFFGSIKVAYMILIFGALGGAFALLVKRSVLLSSNFFILLFIISSSIIGIYMSFYILGVGYPIERALLHLCVLFVIYLFVLFDEINIKLANYFIFLIPLFLGFSIIGNKEFNLSYVPIWRETTFHKSFLKSIDFNSSKQPLIYGAGPINKSLNHYNVTDNVNYNMAQEGGKVSEIADYLVLFNHKSDCNREKYELLDSNTGTGVKLFKRKENIIWNEFHKMKVDSVKTNNDFHTFFEINLKSDSLNSIRNEIKFNCLTDKLKDNVWLVYVIKNDKGETLHYNGYSIDRLFNNRLSNFFEKSFYIEDVSKEATVLSGYIWNIKGEPLHLTNIEITNLYN